MAKPGASLSFMIALEEMQCSTLVVRQDSENSQYHRAVAGGCEA